MQGSASPGQRWIFVITHRMQRLMNHGSLSRDAFKSSLDAAVSKIPLAFTTAIALFLFNIGWSRRGTAKERHLVHPRCFCLIPSPCAKETVSILGTCHQACITAAVYLLGRVHKLKGAQCWLGFSHLTPWYALLDITSIMASYVCSRS